VNDQEQEAEMWRQLARDLRWGVVAIAVIVAAFAIAVIVKAL